MMKMRNTQKTGIIPKKETLLVAFDRLSVQNIRTYVRQFYGGKHDKKLKKNQSIEF